MRQLRHPIHESAMTHHRETPISAKPPIQIGLVAASGILVPLCFPPYGLWPLMLLAIPLLFLATTGTTTRRAFYLGMLHGLLAYGLSLYWLNRIFGPAAISLHGILALFTAGFCVVHNHFSKQVESAHLRVLLAATLWTGIEFYRSELFYLRFPWITPGSALGPTFLSPIVGVYGTSFLLIAAAAGLLHRRTIPWAAVLLMGVLLLGAIRPGPVEPAPDEGITVTLVQCEGCSLETYVEMTRTAMTESPDLVVWPEYSLPFDVRRSDVDFAVLTGLCAELDTVLIVGTKTTMGPGARNWHNTALTINEGGVLGEYYKARPVHFFNDGIPGEDFDPIETGLGAIGTPICFDCDYSDVARTMASRGVEFFAVPSCDPAPWSEDQHVQHALLFRLRAAETARWLACAASSGVSQVVDPHGIVHASLPTMEPGVVTYRIGKGQHTTFFVRAGWLFPWLTLVGSALLIGYAGINSMVQRRKLLNTTRQSLETG